MSSVPLSWKAKVSVEGEVQPQRIAWIRWIAFAAISIAGTGLDLWTKYAIFQWRGLPGQLPPWWLIEPYVGIETAVNPGALFGFGAGFGLAFATLSVVAGIAIIVWLYRYRGIESWWLIVALGNVMGGVFGNLYDRLGLWDPPADMPTWASGVRDWILLQYNDQWVWPNFNIADSLLVCGAIMLFVHSLFFTPAEPPENETSTA